jgi:hypothetical protein
LENTQGIHLGKNMKKGEEKKSGKFEKKEKI